MSFEDRISVKERLGVTAGFALVGAIIGSLSDSPGPGALIGAAISVLDVLYVLVLGSIFVLAPFALVALGIAGIVNNPRGWLRLFAVIGSLGALVGGILGSDSAYSTRILGILRGGLLGLLSGAGLTTLLVAMVSMDSGPNIPTRPAFSSPPGSIDTPPPPPTTIETDDVQ